MLKSTLTVLAAAAFLVPAALAEGGQTVTLKHDYDASLLSDDAGAAQILSELKRAAARACTSRVPAYGGQFTDPVCTDYLYEAAVKQIHETGLAAGISFAPQFELAALTQIASID
ncbi:MAG TPA: UrcA family protein [Hyphomonas sp.]|nr:UrcA family protein [Hyphomonas sp.]HRK69336.1 UrcA family protein [Hyphomonas sp.]